MHIKIFNKSAEEQIAKFGFPLVELSQLGLSAMNEFNAMYGENIMNYQLSDMKRLYRDVITRPEKYQQFAVWLRPRLELFVQGEFPLRIYVGGEKQFMQRGDLQLEQSLSKMTTFIDEYIATGKMTPKRLSVILYYLNLIV